MTYQAEQAFRAWKNSGAKPEAMERIIESSRGQGMETASNGAITIRYADGSELLISVGHQDEGPVIRMIWGSPKSGSMGTTKDSRSEPGQADAHT